MTQEKKGEKPVASLDKKKEGHAQKQLIAVVLIRGIVTVQKPIKDTLFMLKLFRKNSCTVMEDTAINKGMLNKVKDYVAYGELDNETLRLLAEKRKKQSYSSKSFKSFRLSPPQGGFERKGIKKPFTKGGVLGYRGSKINALIKKMI